MISFLIVQDIKIEGETKKNESRFTVLRITSVIGYLFLFFSFFSFSFYSYSWSIRLYVDSKRYNIENCYNRRCLSNVVYRHYYSHNSAVSSNLSIRNNSSNFNQYCWIILFSHQSKYWTDQFCKGKCPKGQLLIYINLTWDIQRRRKKRTASRDYIIMMMMMMMTSWIMNSC